MKIAWVLTYFLILSCNGRPENKSRPLIAGILNSFPNVTHWAETEFYIFLLAKENLVGLRREIKILNEYVRDYEATTGNIFLKSGDFREPSKKSAKFIGSSSLASYLMTHRYINKLQILKEIMAFNYMGTRFQGSLWNKISSNSQIKGFQYHRRTAGFMFPNWPSRIDLEVAKHSLIHIQEVYNYNYNELPAVLSPETTKPTQLNAFHFAEIGLHALHRKHYAVAIELMDQAILKVNNHDDSSIPFSLIESYLELATNTHNVIHELSDHSKYTMVQNLFTDRVMPFSKFVPKRERVSTNHVNQNRSPKNNLNNPEFNIIDLCSGKDLRTAKERSSLYCWYDKSSSPVRKLLPYKKELISIEPEITRVFDFVGNKLISRLVNDKDNCLWIPYTSTKLSFAQIMRTRTGSSCWPDGEDVNNLWRKISAVTLTDLKTEGSRAPVHVVDYMFGRIHEVHLDALQLYSDNTKVQSLLPVDGDRLFSMVIYFSDVPAGGSTPFSNARTAAVPIKGSAVFWKNLHKNGTVRRDVLHASCPVIYGHKNVAVALIHSHSQFLTHRCSTNRYE